MIIPVNNNRHGFDYKIYYYIAQALHALNLNGINLCGLIKLKPFSISVTVGGNGQFLWLACARPAILEKYGTLALNKNANTVFLLY
jgi:hypothetical protein